MLKKNDRQIDMFNYAIFEKLVPKDHLLVKIDETIDFSFVYDLVQDEYSDVGRGSKDPVMMVKILLLEYLYKLSDVEVVKRIQTDVVFRWFLGLTLDDTVPDDTTVSYFRIKRLKENHCEEIFNHIVQMCIDKDLVRTNRFIIDSTDVAANANYPSDKKLIRQAYMRVIRELKKFDEQLAIEKLNQFEEEIELEYKKEEKVPAQKHYEIAGKLLNDLYLKTYDELQDENSYQKAYQLCYEIIEQSTDKNKKDKIVSVVDPDARVAHKSPGNIKRGYKNHIIIDEDSEIILASSQTPFNVGDEKKLTELVDMVENNLNIKPNEVSADKVYGTIENRAALKDRKITSNIAFYNESSRKVCSFGIKDFHISENLDTVTCKNGIATNKYKIFLDKTSGKKYKRFYFDKSECDKCQLREQCLRKNKEGKVNGRTKAINVSLRYDAMMKDLKRVETEEFKKAYNKRYKIERRFATLVRNHGLRRCRYLMMSGAKIHITLANIACNVVRMINILYEQGDAMPKILPQKS